MKNRINNFQIFLEGIKTKDLSSIPGKGPGERDYIADVTSRAKRRLGIEGEREGDPRSIMGAAGPLMGELGRSQSLSRGHEKELEELATEVITKLYKPLIDDFNIKLDIKFSNGSEIRRFIDEKYKKQKPNDPTKKLSPVVRARGVDFSMLIHEAVKGIWRVMSMPSVPKDPEIAKAIETQFGLMDEPDDWKYGPEIAADIRDFIFENQKALKFENLREYLWIYMIDEKNIPNDEFLQLIKGILSKTPEARLKVDQMIDKVIETVEKRDKYLKDMERYKKEMEEYERKMAEYNRKMEGYNRKKSMEPPTVKTKEEIKPKDYSQMTQKELDYEISKALDAGDRKKFEEISKYLK